MTCKLDRISELFCMIVSIIKYFVCVYIVHIVLSSHIEIFRYPLALYILSHIFVHDVTLNMHNPCTPTRVQCCRY